MDTQKYCERIRVKVTDAQKECERIQLDTQNNCDSTTSKFNPTDFQSEHEKNLELAYQRGMRQIFTIFQNFERNRFPQEVYDAVEKRLLKERYIKNLKTSHE